MNIFYYNVFTYYCTSEDEWEKAKGVNQLEFIQETLLNMKSEDRLNIQIIIIVFKEATLLEKQKKMKN